MNSSTSCAQPHLAMDLLWGIRVRGADAQRARGVADVGFVVGYGPDAGTPKGVHLEEGET